MNSVHLHKLCRSLSLWRLTFCPSEVKALSVGFVSEGVCVCERERVCVCLCAAILSFFLCVSPFLRSFCNLKVRMTHIFFSFFLSFFKLSSPTNPPIWPVRDTDINTNTSTHQHRHKHSRSHTQSNASTIAQTHTHTHTQTQLHGHAHTRTQEPKKQ